MTNGAMAAPIWDLERVCPGGVQGVGFAARREALSSAIAELGRRASAMAPIAADRDGWSLLLRAIDPVRLELGELRSIAGCAAATDSRSPTARAAEAAIDALVSELMVVLVTVEAAIDAADEAGFAALLARPEMEPLRPALHHARSGRVLRLAPALEALKVAMDREALIGWGRLYDLVSGTLTATVALADGTKTVGVAEASSWRSSADPQVRHAAHTALDTAWSGVRDVCAHTLGQITGARVQHLDRLGVDELAHTLHENRVGRSTLEALWAGVDEARAALVRYLGWKARALGLERLGWADLEAPLPAGDRAARWSWSEATDLVAEAFGGFHPKLADFAREAVAGRWIDAQPREGRRPGGFCTDLPLSNESRIFMTYTGSIDHAGVLAHELGHAFHNRVLAGMPASRSAVVSATAETASTFAEAVLRDRVLATATDPVFRVFMVDQQLQAATAFLMDIPARFQFERRLYVLRREGMLDADRLDAEMLAAQQTAYGGALADGHPGFWCSKLHFYIPEFGFYNWPYTFGYLFSAAVHRRALAEGPTFLATLEELLVRTGWQDTEDLARDVLDVDLADPAFWRAAARPVVDLVDQLVAA